MKDSQPANSPGMNFELPRIQWRQMMMENHYEDFCKIAKDFKYKEELIYFPEKYSS